jgi:pimeloyl-ACP methyl ester carboxylesterase
MSDLAYDRRGHGPPLVLLHPLGADRRVWRPVLDALAAERDVLAFDLPGFGASPSLPAGAAPTPAALARALGGLLAELGLAGGRAHLAGNSLGGWVALEAALAGDAASVTAIAPAGLWSRPLAPKPEIARRAARAARPLLAAALRIGPVRRAALLGVVAHPERVPARDAAALVRAYAEAPGFSAVNRAMRAQTFTRLADVGVPVTLVWPEHDRLVRRPRAVPAAVRQVALADCGHVPMWDAPAAVAQALLAGSARRPAPASRVRCANVALRDRSAEVDP